MQGELQSLSFRVEFEYRGHVACSRESETAHLDFLETTQFNFRREKRRMKLTVPGWEDDRCDTAKFRAVLCQAAGLAEMGVLVPGADPMTSIQTEDESILQAHGSSAIETLPTQEAQRAPSPALTDTSSQGTASAPKLFYPLISHTLAGINIRLIRPLGTGGCQPCWLVTLHNSRLDNNLTSEGIQELTPKSEGKAIVELDSQEKQEHGAKIESDEFEATARELIRLAKAQMETLEPDDVPRGPFSVAIARAPRHPFLSKGRKMDPLLINCFVTWERDTRYEHRVVLKSYEEFQRTNILTT